jgi:PAS domain-containing protein
MAGDGIFGKPRMAGDNLLFLRLRWFLGAIVALTVGLHWGRGWQDYAGAALIGLFLASQLVLWKLPPHWFKGLQLHTAIFLLDLFITIATLLVSDQASPTLLVVLFLTIFISALVKRISLGALVGGVATVTYAAFKLQGPDGFQLTDYRQLLDVPFILLASLHTAIIVSEATFHQDITEALDADNQTLSKKLGSAATELKSRIRFINSAFDAVPAPALVVDGDGLLRSFNRRAEELFTVKRMTVLDKPLKDINFLEPLRQLLRSAGGDGAASGWLFTGKGVRFYASVRSGAARDEDGRLLNLAVFIQPTLAPPEPEPEPEQAPAPQAPLVSAQPAAEGPVQSPSAPLVKVEPSTDKPAGHTSSGIIQRSIAMDTDPQG